MFIVNGKREFIEGFERFLKENKMQYSRPLLTERTEKPERKGIENPMAMIISDDVVRDVISVIGVTLTFLKILLDWRARRRGKGEISIRTANGKIVELTGKDLEKLEFKEKKGKKKKSTRKRGTAHRTRSPHN